MKSTTEETARDADARRYRWIKANCGLAGACVRWPKGVWTIDRDVATLDDAIDEAMKGERQEMEAP